MSDTSSTGTSLLASLKNFFSNKHNWILLFAGFLVLSILIWVGFAGLSIYGTRGESQKAFELSGMSPVNVSVTFNPTLYHGQHDKHGDVAIIYDKDSMDREMARLQLQLDSMVSKAFEKTLNDQSDKYGKRVDDTWSAVQGIGLISAIIGVLITVLVLYFSFQNAEAIKESAEQIKNRQEDLKSSVEVKFVAINQRYEDEKNLMEKLKIYDTKFTEIENIGEIARNARDRLSDHIANSKVHCPCSDSITLRSEDKPPPDPPTIDAISREDLLKKWDADEDSILEVIKQSRWAKEKKVDIRKLSISSGRKSNIIDFLYGENFYFSINKSDNTLSVTR